MKLIENPNLTVIAGENAVSVSQLPPIWQNIAAGKANVGFKDVDVYVKMAQLFQYKLAQGDVDLFHERPELASFKSGFSKLFRKLSHETLEFYGHDFLMEQYPDFQRSLSFAISKDGLTKKNQLCLSLLHQCRKPSLSARCLDKFIKKPVLKNLSNEVKVALIGIDLFNEFGYDLPASFYHVHLAPIYRDHVFEERALRFDKRDIKHKRSWDAILHSGKVFAVQMKVQSIASKYGFTYHHGCGCNSHLSSIDISEGDFNYELSPEKYQRWIRSFIWTAWYEYAFFQIVPNTSYLV